MMCNHIYPLLTGCIISDSESLALTVLFDLYLLSLNLPEESWRPWWRCGLHRQSRPHLCLCFSLLFLICRIYLPSPQPLPPLPPVQLTSFWKRKTFIRSEAWAEAGWFLNISIKGSQVADSCFYFLSIADWAMCKADWVQHLDSKVLAPALGSATNGFHIF